MTSVFLEVKLSYHNMGDMYRDHGKENGNYYLGFRVQVLRVSYHDG